MSVAWQKVGASYFSLNQFDQALEAFQKALALREQGGDVQETANALIDLGVTYASKGDFTAALGVYQRAKALFESTNNALGFASADSALGFATVLLNEGMVSYAQKDYAKTIEQADKAAALAKQFRGRTVRCIHRGCEKSYAVRQGDLKIRRE